MFVTSLPVALPPFAKPRSRTLRTVRRWALMIGGLLVVLLGLLIAPLPGPGGVPVMAVGLILILKSSFWAKRQFIRAQYARPKWVYPFRRLMRKKPEFAPVFWQQALRAEKVVVKRSGRSPVARPQTVAALFPQAVPVVDADLAVALLQPLTTAS